jgi:peptidyl-Asp metalloendopeptidase
VRYPLIEVSSENRHRWLQVRALDNGKLDQVHIKRALYGSDMVQLLVTNGAYCGMGYVRLERSSIFAAVSILCATGSYAYMRETGHNFDMQHDRVTTNTYDGDGYNYGYRSPNAAFRSITAYNCVTGECDNMPKNCCIRVQRFSNTQFLYNGEPMGSLP